MTVRIKHLLQKLEAESSDPQHSHKCQVGIAAICNPSAWEAETRDPQSWIARVTGLADSGLK